MSDERSSIEGNPILSWEVCSFGQVLLGFLDRVISGGCVPLLPHIDSVAGSIIRVKALIFHEAAARSESASWLDITIECVFLCQRIDCLSDVRGGAIPASLYTVGSGVDLSEIIRGKGCGGGGGMRNMNLMQTIEL